MTFYLKYRPKKVAELDLTDVREQLAKILSSGRIPHAFLFTGPRGAGKTSAARILAKVVNCEQLGQKAKSKKQKEKEPSAKIYQLKANLEPCNQCEQCRMIDRGSSLDVVEIDAASHRGVDDIRSLRETVKLSPTSSAKKVYIIDEAHMLTTEAANALLKTLEEPPAHVMFILATTEPHKILPTVKSRCTTIVFRKATVSEIVASLQKAVNGEKLKVEDGVLEEIAKNVDGSFREAHKILEQLSFLEEKITVTKAKEVLAMSLINPHILISYLVKKDAKGALEEIDKVSLQGVPLRIFASQVLGILRNTLLSGFGLEDKETNFSVSDFGGQEAAKELVEIFSKAAQDVPGAVVPQLPLELAVIKWCSKEAKSEKLKVKNEGDEEKDREDDSKKVKGATYDINASGIPWQEIMRLVRLRNTSTEALLRASRPQGFDGKTLTIEVFYQFHKERLEKDPYRTIIEEVVSQVLGVPVRVVCLLSSTGNRAVDLVNVSEDVQEDIIKVAEEIFGGRKDDETIN